MIRRRGGCVRLYGGTTYLPFQFRDGTFQNNQSISKGLTIVIGCFNATF